MSVQKLSKSSYLRKNTSIQPFEMLFRHVLKLLRNADALAVWCHLQSLPEDWEINEKYIMNHFNWGRDKARNAMYCLILNGLVDKTQIINPDGTFGKSYIDLKDGYNFTTYIEYDKKIHKKVGKPTYIQLDAPLTEKPLNGSTVDGKTAPTEEEIFTEEENEQKNKKSFYDPDLSTKARLSTKKDKYQNSKKHEFAENMNQIANAKRHAKENEIYKQSKLPDYIREQMSSLTTRGKNCG